MNMENLILENLPYAYAVGNRVGGGQVDRDELSSVVRLALTEAAWSWKQTAKDDDSKFKSYLAKIVEREVLSAISSQKRQVSRESGNDKRIISHLIDFAKARDKWAEDLSYEELTEFISVFQNKTGRYVTVDLLKAIRAGLIDTEVSLDSPVDESAGGSTLFEVLLDSMSWRTDPLTILLRREESREINQFRRSPEKEKQLFQAWVEWLPKEQRQIMTRKHVWDNKHVGFKDLCHVKHGGNRKTFALQMSPEQAQIIYNEAIETLRAFARGDFSKASFEFVLKDVPIPLVERFTEELEDELAKATLKYRFLTFNTINIREGKGDRQVTARPTLSTLARTWHKRLEKRYNKKLTKEESVQIVRDEFEKICRKLAVRVGIAPPQVLS